MWGRFQFSNVLVMFVFYLLNSYLYVLFRKKVKDKNSSAVKYTVTKMLSLAKKTGKVSSQVYKEETNYGYYSKYERHIIEVSEKSEYVE